MMVKSPSGSSTEKVRKSKGQEPNINTSDWSQLQLAIKVTSEKHLVPQVERLELIPEDKFGNCLDHWAVDVGVIRKIILEQAEATLLPKKTILVWRRLLIWKHIPTFMLISVKFLVNEPIRY